MWSAGGNYLKLSAFSSAYQRLCNQFVICFVGRFVQTSTEEAWNVIAHVINVNGMISFADQQFRSVLTIDDKHKN